MHVTHDRAGAMCVASVKMAYLHQHHRGVVRIKATDILSVAVYISTARDNMSNYASVDVAGCCWLAG